MSDLLKELEQLQEDATAALQLATSTVATEAWHDEYLSRKGKLTGLLRSLGQLPADERPVVGQAANVVKGTLEAALQERQEAVARLEMESALGEDIIDVTQPGRPQSLGRLHPTTVAMRNILDIFGQMGFQIYDAPEVETDDNNLLCLISPQATLHGRCRIPSLLRPKG